MPGAPPPSEFLASFRRADRLAVGSDSQRFPSPFDDVPRSGPVCGGPVRVRHGSDPGVSHPLAGFLARSSLRVCLAPLPSLGSCSLQSVPLAFQVACPSSGPLAPLPFVPVEPRRGVRGLVTSGLHRLGRRFGRRPSPDPAEARGSLSAPLLAHPPRPPHGGCGFGASRDASRSPWTSYAGLTSVRSFRRLRSVLPCASPFTPRGGHPSRGGRCSPGRPRPSRALLPPSLGSSHPPRPEASLLPLAPRASRRVARPRGSPPSLQPPGLRHECTERATLEAGWARAWTTEASRPTRRRTPDLLRPGPCRPSAATSTPMTFDARSALAHAPVFPIAT